MKELDTAMSAYLEHHYDASDTAEQQLFADLLQEQDPLIMGWLNDPDSAERYQPVIRKIRDTLSART
jgi:succinate dehydrogenase flavin-adding protein (antitoxin of CptAB toxin-antitoxin module)